MRVLRSQRLLSSLLPLGVGVGMVMGMMDNKRRAACQSPSVVPLPAGSDSSLPCLVERHDGRTVVYRNKDEFLKKRSMFVQGGAGKLQVISDFDYTMTKFAVSPGKRGASCHCLIEDSGFLPTTYQTQAKALFHYYYPLEVSSTLTVQEKIPHMQEWVGKAHDLLLMSKLRKSQIKFAVAEALNKDTLALRGGVIELLSRLKEKQVPLLLFSAGLADVIEEVLLQKCGNAQDLHIVSNHMIFENDILVDFSSPSYHVFNKKALYAKDISPYFKAKGLDQRKNLLLLGDSLGDAAMCEGLTIADQSKIKVGFLNDKVERLPDYLQAYDVVLLGDPDFKFVNKFLEDIVAETK